MINIYWTHHVTTVQSFKGSKNVRPETWTQSPTESRGEPSAPSGQMVSVHQHPRNGPHDDALPPWSNTLKHPREPDSILEQKTAQNQGSAHKNPPSIRETTLVSFMSEKVSKALMWTVKPGPTPGLTADLTGGLKSDERNHFTHVKTWTEPETRLGFRCNWCRGLNPNVRKRQNLETFIH